MTEQMVLCPVAIQTRPDNVTTLPEVMHDAGLTGTRLEQGTDHTFETGSAFARLISFIGCSPTIKNADDTDRSFIQFVMHESGVMFLGGINTRPPSCYHCKRIFKDWPELVQQWQEDKDTIIFCPDCKSEKTIPDLNWHYRAAFSNYEIVINGIPEGTALPSTSLLEILKSHTNCRWHYFYRQV